MFGNLIECREHEFFITILHRNALLTLQWKQSKCRKEDRFTKIQDLLQRLYVSHCSYWTVLPVLNCSLYWSSKGCSFFIQLEETRTSWFFVWFWRNRNSSSKCWRYSSSQCAYERHSPPPPKNIQNGGRPGWMPFAFWSVTNHCKSWRGSGYAFLAKSTFCVSLFCDHSVPSAPCKFLMKHFSKSLHFLPQTETQAVQRTGLMLYSTCNIPTEWNYHRTSMARTDSSSPPKKSNPQDKKLQQPSKESPLLFICMKDESRWKECMTMEMTEMFRKTIKFLE